MIEDHFLDVHNVDKVDGEWNFATGNMFFDLNVVVDTIMTGHVVGSSPADLHRSADNELTPRKSKIKRSKVTFKHPNEVSLIHEWSRRLQRTMRFQTTPIKAVHESEFPHDLG